MNSDPAEVEPPRLSHVAGLVALAVFLLAAGFVLSSLVHLVLAPWLSDGRLPQGWTPASALTLAAFSVAALGLLGTSMYRRLHTQLGSEGLSFPSLRGVQHLPWSAVDRASGKGLQIKLYASGMVVTINVLCYANPAGVAPFLQAKLPLRALSANQTP